MRKPRKAPEILRDKGDKARRLLCRLYDASPGEYQNGTKAFTFDARIYAHSTVKKALCEAQHNKCCFCESKVTHIAYGDVEHFRPKAGFRQAPGEPLGQPGYYWLAYAWKNLLFCCQICNQRHKHNHFPLSDPTRRARSHHDNVSGEQPIFIDPSAVDPARFLEYREHYLHARGGDPVGSATINALGLNREELAEVRFDELKLLQTLIETRRLLSELILDELVQELTARLEEIDDLLRKRTQDSAQYAAMARAALSASGLELPL